MLGPPSPAARNPCHPRAHTTTGGRAHRRRGGAAGRGPRAALTRAQRAAAICARSQSTRRCTRTRVRIPYGPMDDLDHTQRLVLRLLLRRHPAMVTLGWLQEMLPDL